MKDKNSKSQYFEGPSHKIKIAIVALLSIFSVIRLLLLLYFPEYGIPNKVFFMVVLCIIFFLWNQELLDFQEMAKMHKELIQMHEDLQDAEIATMAVLIKAVEAKDLYTRGHSEMVKKLALAIAEEMGLDEKKKRLIGRAAILHDIGKIELSEPLLNKSEELTDAEWELFKKHPKNALSILKPLKFLKRENDIILQHHERFDGKGYPKALKVKKFAKRL